MRSFILASILDLAAILPGLTYLLPLLADYLYFPLVKTGIRWINCGALGLRPAKIHENP